MTLISCCCSYTPMEGNNRRLANLSRESWPPPTGPVFYPEVVSAFLKAPPLRSCERRSRLLTTTHQNTKTQPALIARVSSLPSLIIAVAAAVRSVTLVWELIAFVPNSIWECKKKKKKWGVEGGVEGSSLRPAAGLISPQALLIARCSFKRAPC